jgi:hypothetical protein
MDCNTLHYHIRWSSASLYWQRFKTHAEANVRATQLMRPGETYTVEELDANCPTMSGDRELNLPSADAGR